jgi:hypothetical protein
MLASGANRLVIPLRPPAGRAARALDAPLAPPLALPPHPDEHRPKRPVLLAVDQQLGDVRVGVACDA